jgi:hypothetical protein
MMIKRKRERTLAQTRLMWNTSTYATFTNTEVLKVKQARQSFETINVNGGKSDEKVIFLCQPLSPFQHFTQQLSPVSGPRLAADSQCQYHRGSRSSNHRGEFRHADGHGAPQYTYSDPH